jgi:transcriptional regulator with XRE-family HTH domain
MYHFSNVSLYRIIIKNIYDSKVLCNPSFPLISSITLDLSLYFVILLPHRVITQFSFIGGLTVEIAEKIQILMNERGITAYRLAKDTGVSYTGLTKILNLQTKNPQIDSLKLIADYFHKPIDYFTGETETPSQNEENPEIEAEIRSLARDIQRLNPEKKGILVDLIKTMQTRGREAKDE